MELRHLRYFVAVAEELHFGRAAERLHIAQPPLSQRIQRLEKELGAPLLARSKRHVELTDAGRVLLEEARAVLARADNAVEAVRRAESGLHGRLVVGFVEAAPYTLLPTIIQKVRERAPNIHLALVEATTSAQLAGVGSGELDVGFLRGPIHKDRSLEVERIWRESVVLALRSDHPRAGDACVPLASLAADPFVTLPRYPGPNSRDRQRFHDLFLTACRKAGFTPRIVQEASQVPLLVGLVAAGLGASILPASVRHIHLPDVVYRPFQPGSFSLEMCAVWRRDASSRVLDTFIAAIRDVAQQY